MAKRKSEQERFETAALGETEAVYHFAYYLCRNPTDAEDLTQDTFLSAFQKAHQFRPGTNLKAWLFRIARNAHIDGLRRRRRQPDSFPIQDVALEGKPAGPTGQPHSVESWRDLNAGAGGNHLDVLGHLDVFGDEVTRLLKELPTDFRLALVLCDIDEFSYQEISEILGCPVGTVRSRISRARTQLRDKLFNYAQELGYVRPQER